MGRCGQAVLNAFLSFTLAMGLMPAVAFAATDDGAEGVSSDSSSTQATSGSLYYEVSNPLYGGTGDPVEVQMEGEVALLADSADPASYETEAEGQAALAEALVNREAAPSFVIAYDAESVGTIEDADQSGDNKDETSAYFIERAIPMFSACLKESDNPRLGDYLRWSLSKIAYGLSWSLSSGTYTVTYSYTPTYYTTADQETALLDAVETAMAGMALDGKTSYEKICAIYDYICGSVTYDYTNLEDDAYTLKYTAYAAMIDKTSVCQGYATLFYLMAEKAGVDTRVIAGVSNGENHAWNIAQLDDGLYYNLDSTWDAGNSAYSYFLKTDADFTATVNGHERNSAVSSVFSVDYTSSDFYAAYPMGTTAYEPPAEEEVVPEGLQYSVSGEQVTITGYTGGATDLVIPSKIKGYPVVAIGASAFQGCGLTSVSIPEGVASIGNYAFRDCSSLHSVSLPSTLTAIQQRSFGYDWENEGRIFYVPTVALYELVSSYYPANRCQSSLIDESGALYLLDGEKVSILGWEGEPVLLTIPSVIDGLPVTAILPTAFQNYSSLASVTISEGITEIGASAFAGCDSLARVSMPTSVTSIGAYAFGGCANLTSLAIPEGAVSLGERAFLNCSSLFQVTLPSTLESIGAAAFSGCANLSGIVIPEGVAAVGNNAFSGCASLQSLSLPSTLSFIGAGAFMSCSGLASVAIPEGVSSIDDGVFQSCSSLQNVSLPSTLVSIGSSSFSNCGKLEAIVIPEGVTSIGDWAFSNCRALKSVSLPPTLVSIGARAFNECSDLESIFIPEGVTTIGGRAFISCYSLASASIPSTVTSFGECVFGSCWRLEAVSIADGITSIGDYAFQGCSSLQGVTLPSSIVSLGSYAFQNCRALSSIIIPEGVVTIKTYAFDGCSSMGDVVLPSSLISIGANAFTNFASGSTIRVATQDQFDLLSGRSLYLTTDRTSVVLAGSEEIDGQAVTAIDLDTEYAATLAAGEYAYFSYTAPTDGTYHFWTSGDVSASFTLSRGSSMMVVDESYVAGNPTHFYGVATLRVGQTTYLKVALDSAAEGELVLEASRTAPAFAGYLKNCSVSGVERDIEYTGQPVALSPTISTLEGLVLSEGADYTITYLDGISEDSQPLAAAPSEPGKYSLLISAVEGGNCTGSIQYGFEIYDLGKLSAYSVRFLDYPARFGNDGLPCYLYTGAEIEPSLIVARSSFGDYTDTAGVVAGLQYGVDYEVSFSNNVGVSGETATATATITGIGDYEGQILEASFAIVPSIEVEQWLDYCGGRIILGKAQYAYWGGEGPVAIAYTGSAVAPLVSLGTYQSVVPAMQGIDYSVSYEDASGNSVVPVEPGSYAIIVTALDGGVLTNEARIPFEVVRGANIAEAVSVWVEGSNSSISSPDGQMFIAGSLESIIVSIWDMGKALVEGVDYIVTTVREGLFDDVYDGTFGYVREGVYEDMYNVTVTGLGGYEGSTLEFDLATQSLQEEFKSKGFVVNGVTYYPNNPGFNDTPTVYIAEDWTIIEPTIVSAADLVYGIDFTFGGIYDGKGNFVAKPSFGVNHRMKIVGIGVYEGCEIMLPVHISGGAEVDLSSSANAGIKIAEAVAYYDDETDTYAAALLKGLMPSVSVKLYYQHALIDEGEGIESSMVVSEGGESAVVSATGIPSMGYMGTTSQLVKLVDSYDMGTMIADSYVNGVFIEGGEVATLLYNGFDYLPTVYVGSLFYDSTLMSTVGGNNSLVGGADYTMSLRDGSGNSVEAISHAGAYTIVLEGTGNWSGEYEIPVNVVDAVAAIDLQNCTMRVAGQSDGAVLALLEDGVCEPAVSISYGDYQLVEGRDYTLTYGNNTATGNAYVTVTAVDGGNFQGSASRAFRVCDTLDLEKFATLGYELDSSRVALLGGFMPTVALSDGAASLDVVVLKNYDETTGLQTQTELDPQYYDIEFGNNTAAGTAWVKVTGKNGYEGTLSANFNVIDIPAGSDTDSDSGSGMAVSLGNSRAWAGDTVAVPVRVSGNEGVAAMCLKVSYDDSILTPTGVEAGDLLEGATLTMGAAANGSFEVYWGKAADVTDDGVLYYLLFDVTADAAVGTSTALTIGYEAGDICSAAHEDLLPRAKGGSVNVVAFLPGDVYEDGKINSHDALLLQQYLTEIAEFTTRQEILADINEDGSVNMKDLVALAQTIVTIAPEEAVS